MNIVFFSTYLFGGAGSSAKAIVSKLNDFGHKASILYRFGNKTEAHEICTDKWYSQDQLNRAMSAGMKDLYYHDSNENCVSWQNLLQSIPANPDVFVLFWYSQFLNNKLISDLYKQYKVPIVVFMADNAIITGGCHFSVNCDRYNRGCGSCPQINSVLPEDISFLNLKEKKEVFKDIPLHIIAPSKYQLNLVEKSQIPYSSVQTQVLGFPLKKINTSEIEEKYSTKTKLEFFWSASFLNELRKGLPIFFDAITHLDEFFPEYAKKIRVKLIGLNATKLKKRLNHIELNLFESLPVAEFENELRSSHFYLNTSIDDAGPGTMMRAINYGLIPISFTTGIAIDIVKPKNGILLDSFSYLDLSKAIRDAMDFSKEQLISMSMQSLQIAKDVMDEEKTFQGFTEKLSEIIEHHRS